jgi:putative lipoprotein (rSAM/lipoprotein system)
MKKVKLFLLDTNRKIFILLLGILGFSTGCRPKAEYGVPYGDYDLSGKIVSKTTEQPIKNIKIVMDGDSTYSDSNGNFEILSRVMEVSVQYLSVEFTDIDSTQNGSFENLDSNIVFDNFQNGDGWYEGISKENVIIKLNEKK